MHSELDQLLKTGPFHVALRAAIQARGLALHRIQHRLAERGIQVGVTSLSYWQQGNRRPARPESMRAVTALEQVLDLPRDALTRLLRETASAERPAARPYRSLVDAADALQQLLAELRWPADGGVHTVLHVERVRIGARRELASRHSEQVVRAHRDGIDRYVAIHYGDAGCDVSGVRLRAGENCRPGSVRRHGPTGLVAAELLFDRRLRVGDTHMFSYTFEDGTAGPCGEYVRGFSFGGGQYVLQAGFDADALPVGCRSFARTAPGARPTQVRELDLSAPHRAVHLAHQDVKPGLLGISWDWA
ncbi:hypothetical protein E4198_22000 [Streptomyces sp. RKND-216]|uniref:hypothetical protein n=1 Tax=Streptomyces sp. RKND-216 TaxID=2562581 RepID=UPI00109DB620|nr:hypothetical protein [Streptomyces sp. RKND-216]THA27898.1 hypothetical protein E4198_22000 [Streptomyces sp. RKND-216]